MEFNLIGSDQLDAKGTVSTLADLSVTSTAAELNILDGVTSTTAELNILDGVTATAAEINTLDGITATVTELNYVDGVTSSVQDQLDAKGTVSTLADLSVTSTAYRVKYIGWRNSTTAELNILDGVTATAAEINTLDGITATVTELNYVDGVTSSVQDQLDAKQAADDDLTDLADGTLSASKVENNEYFITSAGTNGQVWTSDGDGAGSWVASTAATSVNGLTDALVEDNSLYLGQDPSSTTDGAFEKCFSWNYSFRCSNNRR